MSGFRKMVIKLGEASSRIVWKRGERPSQSEVEEQEMVTVEGVRAQVDLLEGSDIMERLRQENAEFRRRLKQLEETMNGEQKQEEDVEEQPDDVMEEEEEENDETEPPQQLELEGDEVQEDQDEDDSEVEEEDNAMQEDAAGGQFGGYEVKEETLEEQDAPMALSRCFVALPPPPGCTGEAPYRYSNTRNTNSTAPKFRRHCPDTTRLPERVGDPWYCECGRQFPSQAKLTEHVNYYTREPRFFCPRCPIRFTSLKYLRDHLATCHKIIDYFPPGSWGCGDCGHVSVNREAHKAHRLANHPRWTERLKHLSHGVDTALRCLCGREFARRRQLANHLHNYTSPNIFRCTKCPSTFAHNGPLRTHLRMAHKLEVPRRQQGCRVCAALFPSRKELQTHLHQVHGIISWRQPPSRSSGELDDPAERATDHGVASPREGDPLQRCLCGSGYAKRGQLLQHIQKAQKHQSVPFKCPQCPVEFRVNSRLSLHMRRIHGMKDYKAYGCTTCGNTFESLVALRRHQDGEHPQLRISVKKKDETAE